MSMNKGMYSSNTPEYETPDDLFERLDAIFDFDLDPCASDDNFKCPNYFTKEDDGLKKPWFGNVFVNPPYGQEIGKWVERSYYQAVTNPDVKTVVMLIPSRTDTKYWHDYVMRSHLIYFIRGRLKFSNMKNSAPFPSAIVVFKESQSSTKIRSFTQRRRT